MIIYRKNTKEVVMISEGIIKIDDFNLEKIDVEMTVKEQEKQKEGYKMYYRNGLEFEKPTHIIKKELKSKLQNAQTIQEIKDIIMDIL